MVNIPIKLLYLLSRWALFKTKRPTSSSSPSCCLYLHIEKKKKKKKKRFSSSSAFASRRHAVADQWTGNKINDLIMWHFSLFQREFWSIMRDEEIYTGRNSNLLTPGYFHRIWETSGITMRIFLTDWLSLMLSCKRWNKWEKVFRLIFLLSLSLCLSLLHMILSNRQSLSFVLLYINLCIYREKDFLFASSYNANINLMQISRL